MIKFVVGIAIGICLALIAGYLFVSLGGIPMSTKAGPLPMERVLSHKAIAASIGKSAQEQSPLPGDETNLMAGAKIYQETCAGCHGHPDKPSRMAKRVYPHIPQLLPPGKGVTDDPVGTTHWVVKNGIRFSAMPSFDGRLTDPEIWQVSLFLHSADKLPASVQEALKQPPPQR